MTKTIEDVRALIFDMDGVLVDSEPLHLLAYQELFSVHSIEYTEAHNQEFLGCKDIAMAHILVERWSLPYTPEQLVQNKETILARLLKSDAQIRPGVKKLLEEARALKIPCAVASSATLPTIQLVVDVLGIRQYFHHLSSGDEVEHGKPAPDVFLLAAKRLGVSPEHCLVIEDTANGIKAAKAAGMFCIAIPCDATRHQDHSQADMNLASLEEVSLKSLIACAL
jgi:beta-phosphoglucomutase family hydrolase